MTDPGPSELTRLPELLGRLEQRERGRRSLARQLLDAGWQVVDLGGPVQMDVWWLSLRRGAYEVTFGIERGFVDPARFGPAHGPAADFHPVSYAVLGWARAGGHHVALDDPDDFRPDLAAHGLAALEWLEQGNDDVVARIIAAWKEYRRRRWSADQRLGGAWLAETKALGVREIEAAAAPTGHEGDRGT